MMSRRGPKHTCHMGENSVRQINRTIRAFVMGYPPTSTEMGQKRERHGVLRFHCLNARIMNSMKRLVMSGVFEIFLTEQRHFTHGSIKIGTDC